MNPTILLCWPYFPPEPGAASARGGALARYLSDRHTVRVVTRFHDKAGISRNPNVHYLPTLRWFSLLRLFLQMRSIARDLTRGDVVISSVPDLGMGVIGFVIARMAHATWILDARDLTTPGTSLKQRLWFRIAQTLYHRADHIVVTNPAQGAQTATLYRTHRPIDVVTNGIDPEEFPDLHVTKSIDLAFFGSINPERDQRGIFFLLKHLLTHRPDLRVQFIGMDFSRADVRTFREQLRTLPSEHGVECIAELSRPDAIRAVWQSNIGLVSLGEDPHLAYQLPVKIFEYMATRNAIAALIPRDNRVIADIVHKNNAGVVNHDPETLAKAILELLSDPARLKEIQTHNRTRAIEQYDRRKQFQRYDELVES